MLDGKLVKIKAVLNWLHELVVHDLLSLLHKRNYLHSKNEIVQEAPEVSADFQWELDT